jgi:hypothetical protein
MLGRSNGLINAKIVSIKVKLLLFANQHYRNRIINEHTHTHIYIYI